MSISLDDYICMSLSSPKRDKLYPTFELEKTKPCETLLREIRVSQFG